MISDLRDETSFPLAFPFLRLPTKLLRAYQSLLSILNIQQISLSYPTRGIELSFALMETNRFETSDGNANGCATLTRRVIIETRESITERTSRYEESHVRGIAEGSARFARDQRWRISAASVMRRNVTNSYILRVCMCVCVCVCVYMYITRSRQSAAYTSQLQRARCAHNVHMYYIYMYIYKMHILICNTLHTRAGRRFTFYQRVSLVGLARLAYRSR